MQKGTTELKMTAFEHFMWADDRPDTPMTFYLRLCLNGMLSKDQFQQAIGRALKAHPMLNQLAVGDPSWPGRNLYWRPNDCDLFPFVHWVVGGSPFPVPHGGVGIDIRKELGLRFFVRIDDNQTTILLQLHHAVVDARGASRFLEDLLAHYHAIRVGENPDRWLRPTPTTSLLGRDEFGLSRKAYRQRRRIDLQRIRIYFANRPEILRCKPPKGKTLRSGFASSVGFQINGMDFDNLKSYAREHGVTINDVLLRDLFVTLDKWNHRYSDKRGKKVIRLAMAIDMRRENDISLSAANVVSMCFLDRSPADIADHSSLLSSIQHETLAIKRNYMGMALIRALKWFSKVRGGFSILLRPNRLMPCHSTAVLSNLGQPFHASLLPRRNGNLLVDGMQINSLELLPPYRPNTPLAIGVATVGTTMQLAMHYNADVLNFHQASDLQTLYEKQLRTTLNWEPKPAGDLVTLTKSPASGGPLWALPIGKNVNPRAPEYPVLA